MKSHTALVCIMLCAFFFIPADAAHLTEAELDLLSHAGEPAALDLEVFAGNDASNVPHSRQRRATCDLLSYLGVNHAACAAHCILRGNRGGYCNAQAVCVCRN